MMARRLRMIATALAPALLLAAPLSADTAAGVAAWERGDYAQAIREWEGPAAAGDAEAQFNLAQAYRMGRGVEPDAQKAEDLYSAAAAQGNLRAADNYGILLYLRGEHAAAVPLLLEAATRKDPRAQYLLGTAYFNGDGAARDWPRAYALMTLAHEAGLSQANDSLQNMKTYMSAGDRAAGTRLAAEMRKGGAGSAAADVTPPPVPRAAPRSARAAAAAPSAATSNWKVQLGAFGVRGNADNMWRKVARRPELAGKTRLNQPAGKLTVLFATGFADLAEAQQACRSLKRAKVDCLVTR